jgi:probable F420-dependent oxidoreductase
MRHTADGAARATGVTFGSLGVLGVPALRTVATSAEALGYGEVWVAEANGAESFGVLGAVGASTSHVALATGVVPIQIRTPPLTAMGAATLQAMWPERDVICGIGISSPAVAGRWHGAPMLDRPLARLREYVHILRACWSGDTVDHDGDFWTIKGFRLGLRLGERRPTIVIAALNPQMLRLAGEIADGVLLNYVPASHVPSMVDMVRAGGDATIYAYVHACVGDVDAVVDSARRDLWSYAQADGYRRMFVAAGYEDEMARVTAAMAARDRDGAIAAISDQMVDAIDTIGDAGHVTTACRAYVDAGVQVPVLMAMPWAARGGDRMAVVQATMEAAADAWGTR